MLNVTDVDGYVGAGGSSSSTMVIVVAVVSSSREEILLDDEHPTQKIINAAAKRMPRRAESFFTLEPSQRQCQGRCTRANAGGRSMTHRNLNK